MRYCAVLFLIFWCLGIKAQSRLGNVPMHRYIEKEYVKTLVKDGGTSSIRPFIYEDYADSLNADYNLFLSETDSRNARLRLLTDIESGLDRSINGNTAAIHGGLGFGAEYNLKNRLSFSLDAVANYLDGPSYVDSSIAEEHIAPSFGRVVDVGSAYGHLQMQGYIHYKANKFFTFQLGNGKNFLGDGYRSLLLSDVANNYPYFKIRTKVWKISYVNLFARQRHIYGVEDNPSLFKGKYTATHYLDWDLSKVVNIGLFESIVWQAQDTLLNRGFDFNYANPIIFYRPVEYQQGSADNAIMGLNVSVNICEKIKVYGQLVIDEFLLSEMRADSGWWANKYGGQIGVKSYDFLLEGLDLQSELNAVRPYTFSHGSPVQNYAHDNSSLSNPLGSNFWEWVNFIRFTKDKWIFEEQLVLASHGQDSIPSISYGGNIFQPYANRPNDYGNFIGQGLRTNLVYSHLRISYLVLPKTNLRAELGYVFRQERSGLEFESNHYVYIGLKTNLWNRYNDF